MAIDIRATVSCSLGTLISASVSDDYVQGTGLIKCKGNCEISGLITPAIGTAVTFSYTKDGVTYDVPRTLRVLSSFADPFRRTTKVELGCKLTYLQDLQEPLKWDYTDDPDNSGVDPADSAIITIPISAASIAGECLSKLGIAGTAPLSNKFSIAQFDFGAGYVSILGDLLVSECYCGYLDDTETLQLINLSAAGGTGPVFTSANVIDIAQIGVGQLPGDAVTVSYSSLKLTDPGDEPSADEQARQNWEREETIGAPTTVLVSNPVFVTWTLTAPRPDQWEYTYTPRTVTETAYDTLDRVTTRTTTQYTILAELAPGYVQVQSALYPEAFTYGNPIGSSEYTIVTTETYTYNVAAPPEIPKTEPPDGYQEVAQRVEEVSEPCVKMWASTQIYDLVMRSYAFGTTFDYQSSNSDRFIASRTITIPNAGTTQAGTPCTKSTTETFRASGYTQEGQQALMSGLDSNKTAPNYLLEVAPAILSGALTLKSEGTETQISTGRDIGLEQRASGADRINQQNARGEGDNKPDPDNGWRTASSSEVELALGSPLATRRITLSLPYAPDDRFVKVGSPPSVSYTAIASDAPAKAKAYGKAQNMLLMGNRYGVNVQMAPELMPAAPFSPFILQAGGLSALYRTNGTSWTMSADGILASTDALFWGAVGGTGTFWFPVAPGITTLPTTPAVVDGEMTVTTPVPVWNETVPITASTVLGLTVQSLPYALELLTEVDPIATVIGLAVTRVVVANAGIYAITGNAATLLRPRTLIASPGAFAITGNAAALRGPLVAGPGVIVVTGNAAALRVADPYFSSVSLLLQPTTETNGTTTFTDRSSNAHTLTRNGNTVWDTGVTLFGLPTILFDGSGDSISLPCSSSVFNMGTGDWTFEAWVRLASVPASYAPLVDGRTTASFDNFVFGLYNVSGTVRPDVVTSSSRLTGTTTSVASATMTFVQYVRESGVIKARIDGVEDATTYSFGGTFAPSSGTMYLGAVIDPTYLDGRIGGMRLTKGVARSNVVPPGPFPTA